MTPYVSRLVLEWAQTAPEDKYRRLDGSLAFCDLSGFTAMSEKLASLGRLGAEELAEILNTIFSRAACRRSRLRRLIAEVWRRRLVVVLRR